MSAVTCWAGETPAIVLVTGGCVHEHVRRRPACSGHVAMWRRREPLCEPCLLAGEHRHECRVRLLRVDPLDELAAPIEVLA